MTRTQPSSNLALLTDRTFGPYFAGNLISNAGNWIQNIAAATAVFNLTGSATLTGVVSGALWLGSLLLQPYAGALSDRINRRLLLFAGQSLSLVAAAVLAVWTVVVGLDGLPGPWPIIGVTVVIGIGQALAIPASQALVPALVRPDDLEPAIALNSVTYTLGRSIGPVAAAGILFLGGATAGFVVNAFTFLPLLIALWVIDPRAMPAAEGDGSIREGLAYLRDTAGVVGIMLVVTAIGWTSDPLNTLSPAIAQRVGGGDALVGIFVGAFGLGAAVMGTRVTQVRQRVGADRTARGGLVVFGLSVATFGLAPAAWVGVTAMLVAGVGFLCALTTITTWVQEVVPDQLRGRVMAVWGVAFLGSRPFAAVIDGALGDALTPGIATVIAAVPVVAGAVWMPSISRVPDPAA
ncbi:MFS transporter [Euzebya tangerina]|uniref:MFS transporter n=1 Tax=Euzebya tangerina TaxID=591198 RepID=UPI0013C34568|nr:MFS transporter [Euzebya tangerina]